jgi:hypothetical protein
MTWGLLNAPSVGEAIPITALVRIYLQSSWLRGKSFEKASGRPALLYQFGFADKQFVAETLGNALTTFTTDDFARTLFSHLKDTKDTGWKRYVRFGRILLSEIRDTAKRVRALYGEFLPSNIDEALLVCLELVATADRNCEDRAYILDLLLRARELLLKPTQMAGIQSKSR